MRELVSDKGDTLLTTYYEKFYPVLMWDGDDLILDNSTTFLNQSGTRKRPEVLFGTKLVEAMNWIVKDNGDFYYTRGNLRSEADSVPDDVKKDWAHVDQYQTWSELFGYTNEGLQLSPYCDWHFVYLEEAYQKAFVEGVCPQVHLIEVSSTCIRTRDRVWSPAIKSQIC